MPFSPRPGFPLFQFVRRPNPNCDLSKLPFTNGELEEVRHLHSLPELALVFGTASPRLETGHILTIGALALQSPPSLVADRGDNFEVDFEAGARDLFYPLTSLINRSRVK